MKQLMAPIQKTLPYYVINVNATDNSWTSKFVDRKSTRLNSSH